MRKIIRRATRDTAPPDNEGWIEHDGSGDPPIANPLIEVRFNDGDTAIGRPFDWDQNWGWTDREAGEPGIIVAYRRVPLRYRVVKAA